MLNTLASPVIFTEASRPVPLYSGASGGVWYSLLKEWDGWGGGVSLPLRLMSSSLVMSLLVSSEKTPDSNLTCLHSWPVFSQTATLSPALSVSALPSSCQPPVVASVYPCYLKTQWKRGCDYLYLDPTAIVANRPLPKVTRHDSNGRLSI